jgi:hypothetical protein
MKALVLALALLLAPPPKPISPPPPPPVPADQPDAAAAKPTAAKQAKPAVLMSSKPATDPLAECRATCSKSYYFCLQSEDADTCTPSWNQCRAGCLRANPQ